MKDLDNEKDTYIRNKLKEDKLISKKADDVFNKLIKGKLNMEEKIVKEEQAKENLVSETLNKKPSN